MKTVTCVLFSVFVLIFTGASRAQQEKSDSNVRPPLTQDDIKIVHRAREILSSPEKWNRSDNRNCPADAATFSIYCSLEQASKEISGSFAHREAATQEARFVIEELTPMRYHHRLMGFNNDPTTTFADVQKMLQVEEEIVTERLKTQSHLVDDRSVLPAPTGPYSVGRTEYDFVDLSRPDPDMPSGHREIAVWVWYPASPKPATAQGEWMPGLWGDKFWTISLKEFSGGLKDTRVNPLHSIFTHSHDDAPISIAADKYPVLLFAPGLTAIPLEYATLIEDVVSHGYVVAGIVPTYYTQFTVLSDDERLVLTQKIHPDPPATSDKRTSPDQSVHRHNGQTLYMTPDQTRILREKEQQYEKKMILTWSADMIFTLNQLETLNNDAKDRLHGRLDFTQVGAFGHSLGGATSLQVAKDDSRVCAAIDIDGHVELQNVGQTGLPKPLLIFRGGESIQELAAAKAAPSDDDLRKAMDAFAFLLGHGKPGYQITLPGTTHGFSTDLGVMPFFPKSVIAEMGSMDPKRALSITTAYVEAFFDEYLQDKKSPILKSPSHEYPEITFETNKK